MVFRTNGGLVIKYSVVKRAAVKEILGWVTHWEVRSTSIYKWYQSLVTCLTGELALGWMAKAWGVAKTTNKDGRLSPTKLICYQKYLAIKIKFVGIKYWRLLGQILFFSWQKFLLLSMKYFVGKHLQWQNFISSRKTLGDEIRFLSRNF